MDLVRKSNPVKNPLDRKIELMNQMLHWDTLHNVSFKISKKKNWGKQKQFVSKTKINNSAFF